MWVNRKCDFGCQRSLSGAMLSWVISLSAFVFIGGAPVGALSQEPAEYNEKAMALYADAANFQTNGATDLAIEGWKKFLESYGDDPYASKAAHYLGVCYMQQEKPDYNAACEAFEKSVQDKKSEVREESLVNLGWCQFAAAGEGEKQDPKRLQSALDTFRMFLKEKPTSKFADRALFYGGEAAYTLGDAKGAIELYDRLIAMESAKDSPLRCDTFYARGVALEELQKLDDAVTSYRQLIDGCKDERLINDARVRVGDVYIVQKKFAEAVKAFAEVAAGKGKDVPYALVRQAFAHVQANQPQEAAALYERLLTEFPDSQFTAAATLASAQSIYRAGDLVEATKRFQRVISQKDPQSATEAAHWLATIALKQGKPQEAIDVAKKQLDSGATGAFATSLRLDLAEAMMSIPERVADAQKAYQAFFTELPDDPQAPRALYNAAFAAMQLGDSAVATQLADDFLNRFKDSSLTPDVRYIVAESKLMGGAPAEAAEAYQALLADPATATNVQRPLWVLRAGMAIYLAGKHDDAIKLLDEQVAATAPISQRAEAKYIVGASHLAAGRPDKAAEALKASVVADAKWLKADEAMLLLGQSQLASGKEDEARKTWETLATSFPTSTKAAQARYRTAQLTAKAGKHDVAASLYAAIVSANVDPPLTPFALYGEGWNWLQNGRPSEALKPLERVVKEFPSHPIRDESLLALGISLRTLGKADEAAQQLKTVLTEVPEGINRGHALYELALIDQQQKRPAEAAKQLEQLVASVPNYPSMDKVLYEWAWSLKESSQDDKAEATFGQLIEKFPDNPLTAEGHYFIGQRRYSKEQWKEAVDSYRNAVKFAKDKELVEKSLYRLGWALFKMGDFKASGEAFARQSTEFTDGKLYSDALLMVAENEFKQGRFEQAFAAYLVARKRIEAKDESAKNLPDGPERQIRELVFLHGGQSAAQMKKWPEAIAWYGELQKRFPESSYLPQSIYETGFAHQQNGNDTEALKYFETVSSQYRNEAAARARFMMGEIYFGKNELSKAIPEFQRVMYGYGAENAPTEIKNWQAKCGFEAGRCAELLIQSASDPVRREKAAAIAKDFFKFVVEKHPKHELAAKSQERLDVLNRMKFNVGT